MQELEGQSQKSKTVDTTDVLVDLNLYSLTAIKKCCYKFTGDCSIQLKMLDQNILKLIFTLSSDSSIDVRNKLISDFHNELLDQDLREIVSKETEPVRNLILAEAFSKTSLL